MECAYSSLRQSSEPLALSQLSLLSQSDVPLEAGLLRSDNSSLREQDARPQPTCMYNCYSARSLFSINLVKS